MREYEIETFLTSDYIYIPYVFKEKINLNSDGYVFKNDVIYDNYYSPVSGKACGLTEIFGIGGVKKTVIVENDFIDKVKPKEFCVKDLYDINKEIVVNSVNKYIKDNKLEVSVSYKNKYDLRDYSILKDNINIILETLDVISENMSDLEIKIILDKRDFNSYQLLFNNLGTYPNIKVDFKKSDNSLSLYNIIDIYNELKHKTIRDYIYVTLIYENKFKVIKLKRYSNLKDLLEHIKTIGISFVLNNTIKLENPNFLLDDEVYTINVI